MTKTSSKKKTVRKTPAKKSGASKDELNRRREWRFDLPLPVKIEGELPKGKKFNELTQIENICSKGVYFCLDSGVIIGSKLNLVIDMPKELTEGKHLKLCLGGLTVRLEEVTKKERGKRQGVALRFQKKFEILPRTIEEKKEKSKVKKKK